MWSECTDMLPTGTFKRLTLVLLLLSLITSLFGVYRLNTVSVQNTNTSVKRYFQPLIGNDHLDSIYGTHMGRDLNSYLLWKSIRLQPEDKTGNASHRRYGEPLKLYSLPGLRTPMPGTSSAWSHDTIANHVVNCRELFMGRGAVPAEIQDSIHSDMKRDFQTMLKVAKQSCDRFLNRSRYIESPLTKTESSFPIAFSILVYKDEEQFEFLLRTIYRPQNVYCVHIDKKSTQEFKDNVETIVNCFNNVFITQTSLDIKWGEFGVLEAEMVCLRELWEHRNKWRYFINLTGQELPLRTNYELVKILTALNGANNVEAVRLDKTRVNQAGPLPKGLDPVKGAIHVVLSRAFVGFVLHNHTAGHVLDWSRHVTIPDEIYFPTLNYNKGLEAPGSYRGDARTSPKTNPFFGRLKNWNTESWCHGKYVRGICVFGTADLPLLASREELFANKFHFGYHPEVPLCMQELLYNRTADEYHGHLDFNVSYYSTRDFVKNKF